LEAGFKVFGEASVAIEPSESPLDDPAPRQDDKAADGIGTLDDLDGPVADFVESGVELGAAVGAVGKDMPQPRMEISDLGQDQWCAIAILDVGFMDNSGDQQAVGVGEHVALTALDLLAGVVTARTGGLGGLD
jgi:hypothetical protein